jgi:membrane protein insertase Oxa1/YidC/SpoIIIJ
MKKITQIIMVVTTVLILIYDAIAYVKGGGEATISSIIIVTSHENPLLPFLMGVLMGHFFWRLSPNKDTIAKGIDKLPK